jgi:hypothetical protein
MAPHPRPFLTDAEFHDLVCRLVAELDGLAVCQAKHALRTAGEVVERGTFRADSPGVLAATRDAARGAAAGVRRERAN